MTSNLKRASSPLALFLSFSFCTCNCTLRCTYATPPLYRHYCVSQKSLQPHQDRKTSKIGYHLHRHQPWHARNEGRVLPAWNEDAGCAAIICRRNSHCICVHNCVHFLHGSQKAHHSLYRHTRLSSEYEWINEGDASKEHPLHHHSSWKNCCTCLSSYKRRSEEYWAFYPEISACLLPKCYL